ncbi:MAG: hypothetical protein ACOCYU_08595, partial [Brevefilum sp.]
MPVNLIEIQQKLNDFSAQARARYEKLATRRQEVTDLFEAYADRLGDLRNIFEKAAETDANLRCAVPLDEPLDAVVPMPDLPGVFTVMAADGSQINPSRHARVAFCVINVGLVTMVRGSGKAPEIRA